MAGEVHFLIKPLSMTAYIFVLIFIRHTEEKLILRKYRLLLAGRRLFYIAIVVLMNRFGSTFHLTVIRRHFFDEVKKILIQYYPPVNDVDFAIAFRW